MENRGEAAERTPRGTSSSNFATSVRCSPFLCPKKVIKENRGGGNEHLMRIFEYKQANLKKWRLVSTINGDSCLFGHFCSHPLMHEYSWIRRFPFFNAKHRGFAPMTFSISTSQRSDPQKKKKKTLLTGIQMKPSLSWTSTGWQGYPTISYISHMKVPPQKKNCLPAACSCFLQTWKLWKQLKIVKFANGEDLWVKF